MVGLWFVFWQEKDLFSQRVQPALSHIELPINRVPGYLIRDRRPGRHVDLSFSSSAQLVPRLRMSGAVPLLPLYAPMACAETILPITPRKFPRMDLVNFSSF